jgi:hypothetical protein
MVSHRVIADTEGARLGRDMSNLGTDQEEEMRLC